MSCIVFWRHVWRQKVNESSCCKQLPYFGMSPFKSHIEWSISAYFRVLWGHMWRLVCRSWASAYKYEIWKLFDARHGLKNVARNGIGFTLVLIYSMSCLALFFDPMSGVKKLTTLNAAINCPTSAFEPSFMMSLCLMVCMSSNYSEQLLNIFRYSNNVFSEIFMNNVWSSCSNDRKVILCEPIFNEKSNLCSATLSSLPAD